MDAIRELIRDVVDFPKPGIVFKDITPLLLDPTALKLAIDEMARHWLNASPEITKVVGIESRGFILGVPIAQALGVGFVPIRKQGKLPSAIASEVYEREYGPDTIEIHTDALSPTDNVLIVDDVLATGGSAQAAAKLIGRCAARVAGLSLLIELDFLEGRKLMGDVKIESLINYS